MDLKHQLNLKKIKFENESYKYDQSKFSALRLKSNNIAILVFGTGKVVLTGGKDKTELQETAKWLHKTFLIRSYISPFPLLQDIEITNIVLAGSMNKRLNLEKLADKLGSRVTYELEIFPGAVVKYQGLNFTVFYNGKVNVYGLKSMEEIQSVVNQICELLNKFTL